MSSVEECGVVADAVSETAFEIDQDLVLVDDDIGRVLVDEARRFDIVVWNSDSSSRDAGEGDGVFVPSHGSPRGEERGEREEEEAGAAAEVGECGG